MSQPFTVDDARRGVLLEQLTDLARSGVNSELARRRAKLAEMASNPKSVRSNRIRTAEIARFRSVALSETVALLMSYDTETLEQIALVFTTVGGTNKHLHEWLSYNGAEWNRVAGDHRNDMFRDILALRRYFFSSAEKCVHALMETYRALGLTPGSIHVTRPDEVYLFIAPVFRIASASRSIIWLRTPRKKTWDHNGNLLAPEEPEVHEDYLRDHLTPETMKYALDNPKDGFTPLWQHMNKNKQTLDELDFSLFLLQRDSHSSLMDGVL